MKNTFKLFALIFALAASVAQATFNPYPALVGNNADGEAAVSTGLLPTEGYQMVWNGTTWDRQKTTTTIPGDSDAGMVTRQAPAGLTREGFGSVGSGLIADQFTQLGATGSGMTVSQAYGALNILTGTTTNSEFLMRSNTTVSGAFLARLRMTISQSIVNQHFGFYLADLVGSGLSFTTDATGLIVTVTKAGHGFTSANIGQSIYVGGVQGVATSVPGRMTITGVPDANTITLSPVYAATWTRSTTTATVTFLGGNPIFSIAEAATVSASSDTAAIVNGAVSLLTQSSGGITTFACLNAGATSGTLTLTMSAKAWTASGSGTLTLFGYNCYSAIHNGTSTGQIWFDSQRRGWSNGASTVAIPTTASPGVYVQVQTDGSLSTLDGAAVGTSASAQILQYGSRFESLPNDDIPLYLFIQAFNGVSAPASTTTYTIGFTSLESLGNVKVHLAGANQSGAGHALPVQAVVTSMPTTTVSINGNTANMTASGGSTNKSIAHYAGGAVPFTAYSAQAWAAASGSGAVIADTNGGGAVYSFDISTTAWTVGTSTGMVVVVEDSANSGTTYRTVWMTEPITAVGHTYIPPIPLTGRARMRWFHISGSATTATVTVVAQALSFSPAKQVQYFDRTASVGSGTAASGTNSAAYDIAGCKAISVILDSGTATAVASFQVQMSMDGIKWYTASAATAVSGTSAAMTPIPLTAGVYGRFIRITCTATGTTQAMNAIHIYGTN